LYSLSVCIAVSLNIFTLYNVKLHVHTCANSITLIELSCHIQFHR